MVAGLVWIGIEDDGIFKAKCRFSMMFSRFGRRPGRRVVRFKKLFLTFVGMLVPVSDCESGGPRPNFGCFIKLQRFGAEIVVGFEAANGRIDKIPKPGIFVGHANNYHDEKAIESARDERRKN
jgi:hypothetical protein